MELAQDRVQWRASNYYYYYYYYYY